jgi:hypothetical protein
MANKKTTRSRAIRKRRSQFAQFKGKIVHSVEVHNTDAGVVVGLMFDDRTYLCFDVEADMTITPDYSDWKTGNYKPLKRWRPITT